MVSVKACRYLATLPNVPRTGPPKPHFSPYVPNRFAEPNRKSGFQPTFCPKPHFRTELSKILWIRPQECIIRGPRGEKTKKHGSKQPLIKYLNHTEVFPLSFLFPRLLIIYSHTHHTYCTLVYCTVYIRTPLPHTHTHIHTKNCLILLRVF